MKTVKVKIKKDPLFKNIKTHKVLPIFNDLIWPTLLFSLLFFFMRMTTNPIWIIHVFSINMSANITRVPSYHAIPTCILYYQERFMHFFSFLSKLALYHFYIQRQSSSAFIYAIQITISALAIWNICYSLVHDVIRKLWLINIRKKLISLWILSRTRNVKIYSMHVV